MSQRAEHTIDFHIRVPSEVHNDMKRVAAEHDRSLNREMVAAMRYWLAVAQKERMQSAGSWESSQS